MATILRARGACAACSARRPTSIASVTIRPTATLRHATPTAATTLAPSPPPAARLAAAAALAAALLLSPSPALAALPPSPDAALQLESGLLPDDVSSPSAPSLSDSNSSSSNATVPRGYFKTVRGLVASVRDALGADAEGLPEKDVRRRADPAGQRVREFVGRWRDSPLVDGRPYHEEVKEAISELGAFYARAGPRAAVTRDVRESVLGHLARAEAALPPAEKGLLGF